MMKGAPRALISISFFMNSSVDTEPFRASDQSRFSPIWTTVRPLTPGHCVALVLTRLT